MFVFNEIPAHSQNSSLLSRAAFLSSRSFSGDVEKACHFIIMGKDPAFLFYPGDYLRDTQNLSEQTQVAYDRIMCEHMRNICITQRQLKFFTKRLSDEEREELMLMLTEKKGSYQIGWVAESINRRRAYSESRRKNRQSKNKNLISSSYDSHMENEIENEDVFKKGIEKFKKPEISEVKSFFTEKGQNGNEFEKFFYHYESNGWMVGRNKMKSWKGAVSGWMTRMPISSDPFEQARKIANDATE